jgi:hypothetical protein
MKVSHTVSSSGRRFFITLTETEYRLLGGPEALRISQIDGAVTFIPTAHPGRGGKQLDGTYVYTVIKITNGTGYSVVFAASEPLIPHDLPFFNRVKVNVRGNHKGFTFKLPRKKTAVKTPDLETTVGSTIEALPVEAPDLETVIGDLNRIIANHPDKPTISVVDNRLRAHITKTIGG